MAANFSIVTDREHFVVLLANVTEREHRMSLSLAADKESAAVQFATQFGEMLRNRREALGMRQDDLALATGLGRRFIIELEGGKPSAQLGKALLAANALGLRPFDVLSATGREDDQLLPDLPEEFPDLPEEPHE
jgi:DNA-binding XRE family transcriptional regulator